MNFLLISMILAIVNYQSNCTPLKETEDDLSTTTMATFTVQRLDAPIERIEIRLIDENETTSSIKSEHPTTIEPFTTSTEVPTFKASENDGSDSEMYKKIEYVMQPTQTHSTEDPIVIGENPSYYQSTPSSNDVQNNAAIQAKAWISVSETMPKFNGDIDEDDLPPPPSIENEDEKDTEEECLANKDHLSDEVVNRLKAETAYYYRLVKTRNDQQKEFCTSEIASNTQSDLYRRCNEWRSEKLVYYYKLMRKTYCHVEHWPNPSKVKKTYGEYLNLFGTFYAFQK